MKAHLKQADVDSGRVTADDFRQRLGTGTQQVPGEFARPSTTETPHSRGHKRAERKKPTQCQGKRQWSAENRTLPGAQGGTPATRLWRTNPWATPTKGRTRMIPLLAWRTKKTLPTTKNAKT
eukprot:721028-Amphidinium_carterae.1